MSAGDGPPPVSPPGLARPGPFGRRLRRLLRPARLGPLRRTAPVSQAWGWDRGTPVDRWYIERFLAENAEAISGRLLEVNDSRYTDAFGRGVARSDVLDIDPGNTRATICADLVAADAVPADTFDCFILTQTLQFIFELESAVRHCHRILAPGGVLLCTVPAVSRLSRSAAGREYWRFTEAACAELFGAVFGTNRVSVAGYGNVLSAVAFLMGLSAEELSEAELRFRDPFFPVVVAVRAAKRESAVPPRTSRADGEGRDR